MNPTALLLFLTLLLMPANAAQAVFHPHQAPDAACLTRRA